MSQPEFDKYSASYKEMLKDPIIDTFSGGQEFFHRRKRDLIRRFFRRHRVDSKPLRYLDVGCGQGELAAMLSDDFAYVAGCDPSSSMLASAQSIEVRKQDDPGKIPFESGSFDFATAVCVYHHVPPPERAALTAEVARVLRPGGIFAIIEHNPWNPATRIIVKRSPIDQDAVLLNAPEARSLMLGAGLSHHDEQFFLYFPENIYQSVGAVENMLTRFPLGGQYAVFGKHA